MKAKLRRITKRYTIEESKFKQLLGIPVKEDVSKMDFADGPTEMIEIITDNYDCEEKLK